MEQILNIDTNNESKKIDITSTNPIGQIDINSDNGSAKGSDNNSPKVDNVSKPEISTTPNLGVVDSIGIDLLSSKKNNTAEVNILNNDSTNIPTNDEVIKPEVEEFKPIHRMSSTEIKNEKIDYIYKFKKLGEQGIRTTMNYNMNSNLDEMRNEYLKLKKQREIENGVKFQRKMLMAFCTGVEFLNNKFDPFDVKLDGWSETVNENLFDYDEIFEELYLKYGGGDSDIAPELRLLFALGGSAFMFHLQNTMFKSSLPGMDDIMKQNPELMQQFAKAAVGSMNNQSSGPPPGMMGMMSGMMGSGMMGGSPRQPPEQSSSQPPRQEMQGPDGLDDIIKTMNLDTDKLPELDNISLISGDSDRKSGGITLNL